MLMDPSIKDLHHSGYAGGRHAAQYKLRRGTESGPQCPACAGGLELSGQADARCTYASPLPSHGEAYHRTDNASVRTPDRTDRFYMIPSTRQADEEARQGGPARSLPGG
jgi:hypothetical protein